MSHELDSPVVVDFPLRGEAWMAVTTPAARVPSHGVDMLGQRYAFDFVKVDDRPGVNVHPASTLAAAAFGVRTRDCYAWGASVHAPFDGRVVAAVDGIPERQWVHPVREVARMTWNGLTFRPDRLLSILGNHVILRADRADGADGDPVLFAGFAHLAPESVAVAPGATLRTGDLIGRVGHTGNSTSPHLHFQLMDSADVTVARGIPCAFAAYERRDGDGRWRPVERGIPGPRERIRAVRKVDGTDVDPRAASDGTLDSGSAP